MMNKEEKLLLLELLMRDIRGAFPSGKKDLRLLKVLELSKDLGLNKLYEETKEWIKNRDYLDGRFFRDCDMNYDVINKMHNLKPTYKDKSYEFCKEATIIQYKDYRFSDYTCLYKYELDLKYKSLKGEKNDTNND